MEDDTKKMKLTTDPDYIAIKRFDYSLTKLRERYPEEVPDSIIAQALMIEEKDVARVYAEIVGKIRAFLRAE